MELNSKSITPQDGACRCGRVVMRITKAPLFTAACHCRGCQRMSSSAFSLTMAIPVDGFEVVKGEPVIGGMHGEEQQHYCCGHCMSWLFTRHAHPFVNVRPTMFDDVELAKPFIESFTRTRIPGVSTGAPHSYDDFPPMEKFGELLADYAAKHP